MGGIPRLLLAGGLVLAASAALPAKHKHGRGCGHAYFDPGYRSFYYHNGPAYYRYYDDPYDRWEHKRFHKAWKRYHRDHHRYYYYVPPPNGVGVYFYWRR
jgi:hypothetical protein